MKKKNSIIAAAVIIIIVVGIAGFFVLSAQKSTQREATLTPTPGEQLVPSLSPDDIGLTLSPSQTGKFAGHGVVMTITKLDGISGIDYELSYTSAGNVPRGAIGHVDVKSGQPVIKQEIPFGTCSDVCHFDSSVADVKIVLKVTKSDGQVFQIQQTLAL